MEIGRTVCDSVRMDISSILQKKTSVTFKIWCLVLVSIRIPVADLVLLTVRNMIKLW